MIRQRATAGGQQKVLHHLRGSTRVKQRVGQHALCDTAPVEAWLLAPLTPFLDERIPQVFAVDLLVVRRPAAPLIGIAWPVPE
ncbi:MAG: hypothetical protein ACRDTA_19155 [Pseudonocardiaceae bacterium]